jgi:hypothetical protein
VERESAFHDEKNRRILQQQEAYEGILRREKPAAEWESRLHPPLINHAVETAMTMLLESNIDYEIKPLPKEYKGKSWDDAVVGAKANEALFDRQMGNSGDRFNEFQRPFVLQAAINRVSVAKTHWRHEEDEVDFLDAKRIFPLLGRLSPTKMVESKKKVTLFDGPVTETVDLRDFYWPESAVSLDRAPWCAHAVWMSSLELREKADAGIYTKAAVDAILAPDDTTAGNKTGQPEGNEIELERERRGRKNGMYEVLEVWDKTTRTLYVIGARRTLLLEQPLALLAPRVPLRDDEPRPLPLQHPGPQPRREAGPAAGRVLGSAQPDVRQQPPDQQRHHRHGLRLRRSRRLGVGTGRGQHGRPSRSGADVPARVPARRRRPAADGQAAGRHPEPGDGPAARHPDVGTRDGNGDRDALADRAEAAQKMKDQVTFAYQRIGYQRMRLNGQFIRETQHFIKPGPDGMPMPFSIPAHVFLGDFDFELKPSADSAIRAEKRSEAQSLATWAMQAAPVWAMSGSPLNLRAFSDKLLDAFDVDDTDEFYSAQQQPPGGGPQAPPQGGAGAQPEPPQGVTGPAATSPVSSPSNTDSLAGGVAMARSMAARGGLMGNQVGGRLKWQTSA